MMMLTKIILAGMSLMLCFACGSPTVKAPISIKQRQASADKIDARMTQAGNQFGLKVHERLIMEDQTRNIFISPLSLSLAIAMVYNGSAGDTRREIEKALGWNGWSIEEINKENLALQKLLLQPGKGIEFKVANSIWSKKGIELNKDFIQTNLTYYDAQVTELDFSAASAAERINAWVKKQTKNKITKMVEHPIHEDIVMFLLNAIYFKGEWTKPFNGHDTQEGTFNLQDGSTKKVMMMSQSGSFQYSEQPRYQAIRLPYGEGQMNMLIVVPAKASSLDELHQMIWSEQEILQQPFPQSMGSLKLPRFKIEFEETMNSVLEALGMKHAFDPQLADFSGISEDDLFISSVRHKSYLEVNEKGSEAAAVTSVEVSVTSAPMLEFDMNVNRPFFVAIEDQQTGAWLFMGTIIHPE